VLPPGVEEKVLDNCAYGDVVIHPLISL
jgi:hypothetical protein